MLELHLPCLSDLKTATSIGCVRWVDSGYKVARMIPFLLQNKLVWRATWDESIKSITGRSMWFLDSQGSKMFTIYS